MIYFTPASADGQLLSELKDASVLTPDVIDRVYSAMGRPESGTLDEFLQAGADFIPHNGWLTWLIRRHGCHRFGKVAWHETAVAWPEDECFCDGNIPYRTCANDRVLVAVSRPDRLDATRRRLRPLRPLWAAATLGEIRELKTLRRAPINGVTPLEHMREWAVRP
jgi:hypothetical protein